jgi:hypothetical protein
MSHCTSRLQSSCADEDRALSRHSHALEHLAELQSAVSQSSRDIASMQSQINASYSGAFMCFRSIVSAAKSSEAAFSSILSPLISHSEHLIAACDDALRQLKARECHSIVVVYLLCFESKLQTANRCTLGDFSAAVAMGCCCRGRGRGFGGDCDVEPRLASASSSSSSTSSTSAAAAAAACLSFSRHECRAPQGGRGLQAHHAASFSKVPIFLLYHRHTFFLLILMLHNTDATAHPDVKTTSANDSVACAESASYRHAWWHIQIQTRRWIYLKMVRKEAAELAALKAAAAAELA